MEQKNEVGYGRPPAANRFKSGVSGNPKGRPKNSKNFASDLRDELATFVPDRAGADKITKQRAIVNRLVADAIAGDARATATIVSFFLRSDQDSNAEIESVREGEILKQFRGKRSMTESDHAPA